MDEHTVTVSFDDDLLSSQEIASSLGQAGFHVSNSSELP